MDYLRCVCEQAQYRPKLGSQEPKELFSCTGDGKARICMYGSQAAITAFSNFERLGAAMATEQQRAAFTQMVSIMRSDSGSELCLDASELQDVLLGVREGRGAQQ